MEAQPTPSGPDVDRLLVPDDLHRELHDANERFHEAKKNLEEAMDESEYDHGRHVHQRLEEFRKVEREIEELNAKVNEVLGRGVEEKK
jgi:hypothetical protein